MTTAPAHATFTLRAAQQTLGLSRTVLAGLIDAGFVSPGRGPRNALRFTFQDLMLLRTAHALQRAGIAPRKIVRALAGLKSRLPATLPLSGLRITAVGADVAVRDREGRLESTTGQWLLDFDVAAVGGAVAFLDRPPVGADDDAAADDVGDAASAFALGEALEASDPDAAEAAYREALRRRPAFADAYLNLGAMLCEAGRCGDAVALYDAALRHCADVALIHFNRAVALEDQGRIVDAVASYEASLQRDPTLADAHFNIGRLQQQRGDARGALRHFSAYRRLTVRPRAR